MSLSAPPLGGYSVLADAAGGSRVCDAVLIFAAWC
jgi:hypothetical protein